MVILKTIFQLLYPYGIFRAGEPSADNRTRCTIHRTRTVYLTFDDGPIPEVTPKVLEILDRYQVKATFFMVGENIDKHPEVFRQVLEAGHSVANHTYNHMKGWHYSTKEYLENTAKCQEAIERNGGTTCLFRPPYGRTWWWQRKAITRMGYRIYLWDVLTRDYNACQSPEAMMRLIKRRTRPGSLINFHDSIKSNERMLAVLPQAIEWLQAQGYELRAL